MKPRLNPYKTAPSTMQPMVHLEDQVMNGGLELSLIELVKTRASQINGCAYCIHMHTRDARAAGESEERLYLLDACVNRRCTVRASAPPWHGPKLSRWSRRPTRRTGTGNCCRHISPPRSR